MMQQFFGLDAQQVAYNQYNYPEETTNNWWRFGAYAGALKSGSVIVEKAQAEGQPHYSGIAKVLMAEGYGLLTIFMGDIPFSDALKGTESLKPAYDTQEAVWNGILGMLDQAISELNQPPASGGPSSDDLIFGGDADAWIKTAHALKARYLIQRSKRDNGAAASALQEVNQSFTSVADAPFFQFDISEIGNNPLAKFGKERPATLGIDARFAQQMSGKGDPRQSFYMNDGGGTWEYFNSTKPNLHWSQDNSAIPIISYVELMFIRAESLLRTNASDANALTLEQNTNDRVLDIAGDVFITNKGILEASSEIDDLFVAGDWNNAGTFTHNTGEVTFDAGGGTTQEEAEARAQAKADALAAKEAEKSQLKAAMKRIDDIASLADAKVFLKKLVKYVAGLEQDA